MDDSTLATLTGSLLGLAVDSVESPPERIYVAHGEPAWDCDQLSTHVVRVKVKPQLPPGDNCVVVPQVTLAVVLLRKVCVTDDRGNPPSPQTLDAEGRSLASDGWRLWRGLTRAWKAALLASDVPHSTITFLPLEPFTPQGGLAGWRMRIDIDLR